MSGNLQNPRTLWPHIAPCLGLLGGLLASIVVFYFAVTMLSATPRGQFILRGRAVYDYEAIQQYVMDYARQSSDANDVIFLGGSACREDIETNLFEKLTGLRAYNLGSMGIFGYDGMAVVFNIYLQHHPAPRLLVFCVHPSEATAPISRWGPVEIHDRFMNCYGDSSQTPPPVTAPQPVTDPPGTLESHSLIAALRRDARYTCFIAIHGVNGYENMPLMGFEKTYNQLAQEIARDKGYMGNDQVIAPSMLRSDIAGYPFTHTSDAFKTGTAAIARLAQAHGVKVLIFFAPVPLEAANPAPAPAPGRDPLHAWSSGVQPYCPGAIVSKPEMLLYPRPFFSDKFHLNRRGAVVLTTALAQEVRRLLGGPASSSLPTFLRMKAAF